MAVLIGEDAKSVGITLLTEGTKKFILSSGVTSTISAFLCTPQYGESAF